MSKFEEWFNNYQESMPMDHGHKAMPSFPECWNAATESMQAKLDEKDEELKALDNGKVLLPRKLTAENGAKGLLSGEFFEKRERECPECFDDVDRVACDLCDGEGHIYDNTMISWTTIKAIYDKIVEHYGNP
jgi:hypothetical protein